MPLLSPTHPKKSVITHLMSPQDRELVEECIKCDCVDRGQQSILGGGGQLLTVFATCICIYIVCACAPTCTQAALSPFACLPTQHHHACYKHFNAAVDDHCILDLL